MRVSFYSAVALSGMLAAETVKAIHYDTPLYDEMDLA